MKTTVIRLLRGIFKVGKKVADNSTLGGAVDNISEDNAAPVGKIDKLKLISTIISSTIPVLMLIGLMTGVLTVEDIKGFVKATRDLPGQLIDVIGAIAS
jgi:hypothetical protein